MNQLAIVTGGTKGIGKAIIMALANSGFDIMTCARNMNELESLKAEVENSHNVMAHVFQADLSIRSDIDDFYESFKALNQPLEILVHNTGLFAPGQILSEEPGVFEQLIDTNLASVYHLSRRIVPHMVQRQKGHIFTLCSTASIMAYSNGGSYCISKFALLGLTKVLREELKEKNIKVTAVLPGATYTPSWEGADIDPERFMKSEDVAEAVLSAYSMSPQSVVEEILIRPQLGDL